MAWVYLVLAGIAEWGWPVGLKLAWRDNQFHWGPTALAAVSIALSGILMFLAQKSLPMGTVYAVWTGIGAVGTLVIGVLFFDEPADFARFFCAGLIIVGVIGLKVFSPT